MDTEKYTNGIVRIIHDHDFAIQGVFDTNPTFIYSVGAAIKTDAEFICIANADIRVLHQILDPIIRDIIVTGKIPTEEFNAAVTKDGHDLRGRLVDVTFDPLVQANVVMRVIQTKDGISIGDNHTIDIYQLILGDDNNIMPGEPGYDTKFIQSLDGNV